MRIKIEFSPQSEKLSLPIHHNSLIQGFIYSNLDNIISSRLHNEGVAFGKRQFRFFTYSRLYGKYSINKETIEFTGPLKIHMSSIHEDVLESFVKHLLIKGKIQLGSQQCELLRIDVEEKPKFARPIQVKTLSPITVYSTLTAGDGRKKNLLLQSYRAGLGNSDFHKLMEEKSGPWSGTQRSCVFSRGKDKTN